MTPEHPTPDERPLTGKVVLDLTTALSGPYATLLLADLGARVIKIENPARGGDTARNNSPYFTSEGLQVRRLDDEDMSVSMMLRGRNKDSIALDLKKPEGLEVFRDLVRHADMVVENYSAGVTGRLGIDYASIRDLNPRLVYASISGFGSQGAPGSGKAMDTIIQALSGTMMTAGSPGQPPVRFGLPIGDLVAPLFAVIGVLAALRQRDATGRGQRVDIAMLDALVSICDIVPNFWSMGLRNGDLGPLIMHGFRAADGWFIIQVGRENHFAKLVEAIGHPEWAQDPRFAERQGWIDHLD
ncbi:MAG: CoA transferase, partial [Salinibacterium sp.]|nr:CoA transferase [Salinibacterium sp.]